MTVRGAERMIARSTRPEVTLMARKASVSLDHACDLWLGELARRGRAQTTRTKYRQLLEPFCARYEHLAPAEITTDHCRSYLDGWANHSPSTLGLYVTALAGFFGFLYDEGIIARSPMERIGRPRRLRPEDTHVVTVSLGDLTRMFAVCDGWQELICLAVLAFTGCRRRAAARVRLSDVDFDNGTIRFREKGRKQIVKPMADELRLILQAAAIDHLWDGPNDYLIPNRKPWLVRSNGERGHKMIYETVKRIAARAGVNAHVHSLRGAFAVAFDEAHPGQLIALQELLGHARVETTRVYLRRKDKRAAMELVRDLSFGLSAFPASALIPPAGFEPALPGTDGPEPHAPVVHGEQTSAALRALERRLQQVAKRGRRVET